MIQATELIRERNIFTMHGISIRGAHYKNGKKLYSIKEKFDYIQIPDTIVSAFTYNNSLNQDSYKHLFSMQGFILNETDIIHAKINDAGTPEDISEIVRVPPNCITDMDNIIDSNREKYNELLITKSNIIGFYYGTSNSENSNRIEGAEEVLESFLFSGVESNLLFDTENLKTLYTEQDIIDFHKATGIKIYKLCKNKFHHCIINEVIHVTPNTITPKHLLV